MKFRTRGKISLTRDLRDQGMYFPTIECWSVLEEFGKIVDGPWKDVSDSGTFQLYL